MNREKCLDDILKELGIVKDHVSLMTLGNIANKLTEFAESEVDKISLKQVVMRSVCEPNHHNLDVLHLGCCSKCGGTKFRQTDA